MPERNERRFLGAGRPGSRVDRLVKAVRRTRKEQRDRGVSTTRSQVEEAVDLRIHGDTEEADDMANTISENFAKAIRAIDHRGGPVDQEDLTTARQWTEYAAEDYRVLCEIYEENEIDLPPEMHHFRDTGAFLAELTGSEEAAKTFEPQSMFASFRESGPGGPAIAT